MRIQQTEEIGEAEFIVDIASIDDRPLCPSVDHCCVCDWLTNRGPQPMKGQQIGPNHGRVN